MEPPLPEIALAAELPPAEVIPEAPPDPDLVGSTAPQSVLLPDESEILPPSLGQAPEPAPGDGTLPDVPDVPDEAAESSPILEQLLAAMEEENQADPGPVFFGDFSAGKPAPAAGAEEQHIVFTLAGTDYAVPISNVMEIGRPHQITPLPHVPDWLLGLTNLWGDVISIVDLRGFLDLGQSRAEGDNRLLVVRSRQENMTTGLVVDRVKQIVKIPAGQITTPAGAIEDQVGRYLRGVMEQGDRLLVFLDFDRLLLSSEMRQFESV
jgi:purine-binding chemotaxis protein CheW